jgi:TPR repeat protein
MSPSLMCRRIAFFLVFLVFSAALHAAPPKEALLIANGKYSHFAGLANPGPDSAKLGAALEQLGFRVRVVRDGNREQMLDAISEFERGLRNTGAIAFFHYGGHGVQVDGKNYLLPADADIPDERRVATRAVALDEVMTAMDAAAARASIIVIDACRDNPLPAGSGRNLARGLSVVGMKPKNSMVIYAAEAGSKALDGLFTPILASSLLQKGRSINQIMMSVRSEVYAKSSGQQTPGEYNQLFEELFLGETVRRASSGNNQEKNSGDTTKSSLVAYPPEIKLIKETTVPLMVGGRVSGSAKIPPGKTFKVIGTDESEVLVAMGGSTVRVPKANSNFDEALAGAEDEAEERSKNFPITFPKLSTAPAPDDSAPKTKVESSTKLPANNLNGNTFSNKPVKYSTKDTLNPSFSSFHADQENSRDAEELWKQGWEIIWNCTGNFEDDIKTNELWLKSAEKGYAPAQFNLAMAYYYGNGVEKDRIKAVEWLRKAAEKNYGPAQYNLGFAYEYGEGLDSNASNSFKWYLKAADNGVPIAMYAVGDCYRIGYGINKNIFKSIEYYELAAKHKAGYAAFVNGLILYMGEGIPKKQVEGLALMYASTNYYLDTRALQCAEFLLSESEIAAAKKLCNTKYNVEPRTMTTTESNKLDISDIDKKTLNSDQLTVLNNYASNKLMELYSESFSLRAKEKAEMDKNINQNPELVGLRSWSNIAFEFKKYIAAPIDPRKCILLFLKATKWKSSGNPAPWNLHCFYNKENQNLGLPPSKLEALVWLYISLERGMKVEAARQRLEENFDKETLKKANDRSKIILERLDINSFN